MSNGKYIGNVTKNHGIAITSNNFNTTKVAVIIDAST